MDPTGATAPPPARRVPHAKPSVSRRVAAELELSHTHTESSVKHSALGTFTSFRLVDDRDGFRVRAAAVCLRTVAGAADCMEHEVRSAVARARGRQRRFAALTDIRLCVARACCAPLSPCVAWPGMPDQQLLSQ